MKYCNILGDLRTYINFQVEIDLILVNGLFEPNSVKMWNVPLEIKTKRRLEECVVEILQIKKIIKNQPQLHSCDNRNIFL